ncbi:uncharacterized protein LOC144447347 isoform X2 [Glandiceps talaboti]
MVVKHELYLAGYRSPAFFTTSSDTNISSRQLLLAVGWIIAKYEIIDKMMTNTQSPIDVFHSDETHKKTKEYLKCDLNHTTSRDKEDLTHNAKYLLWVNGRLLLTLRGLFAVNVERQALSHQVQEATQGVSLLSYIPHLTVQEAYLLRHPKLQSKCLEFIEAENSRLQVLLKWKENEDIFWKWMESVVDAQLKEDSSKHGPAHHLELEDFGLTTNIDSYQLVDLHSDLGAILNDCHGNVDEIDKVSRKKISNVAKKQVVEYLLKGIDQQIAETLNAYPRLAGIENKKSQKCPQFVLKKKTTQPTSMMKIPKDVKEDSLMKDVDEEIKTLMQIRDEYQTDLDILRHKHRDSVSLLAQHLDDVVCIPPMARK